MSPPDIPPERPPLVKLGLWGLKSRRAALGFMWGCIVAAALLALFEIWPGLFFLLAAVWYWYAVTWVDKNEGWK